MEDRLCQVCDQNAVENERSHLAQFRCAVLPLKIETGRFLD